MTAEPGGARRAQVCLLLEGTYPYVSGGVSSWVHDIVGGLPELSFALLHIGARRGMYGASRYQLPGNVTELSDVYCQARGDGLADVAAREALVRQIDELRHSRRAPRRSRTLEAIRRLHLDDGVDDELIADLAEVDVSMFELLYGDAAFALVTELYERLAPETSFLDFFWHFRSMHVPILRLLEAPIPQARLYHSISTGYAGLLGAVASARSNRPFLLTEHGIYARERDMELSRATWIHDVEHDARIPNAPPSRLRRFWSRFFLALSRVAYHRASAIVTLSEVNRNKQLRDGAPAHKIAIVPNGVNVEMLRAPTRQRADDRPLRVGFVGRVVPIKDVMSFIKACDLALRRVQLDVRIIGPTDEEPAYVERCKALVATLGREREIRFLGPTPLSEIYGDLDVVVLTSFSEGQPLVILEAHAAGIPVIATDVGACRELLAGGSARDRALGPSGMITRVGSPAQTAEALVSVAASADLRRRLGETGRVRVETYYRKDQMIESYRVLYRNTLEVSWLA